MTSIEATKDTKKPLPAGWRWAKLGKVCEIIAGQSPPGSTYRTIPEGLPFFQGKADFGLLNPVPRVWCVEPNKIALPGDILISVRAPVGPTNVADVKCCIGRGLAALRCGGDSDRDFILSALRRFESKLTEKGAGSTFEAISRADLEQLSIPLPPLDEQRRIAGALREQMATVEKARAAAQARLATVKALPAACLRQVFPQPGQPLPVGWRWVRLGEVCTQDRQIVEPESADANMLNYYSLEHIEAETGRILKTALEKIEDEGKSTTFRFDERHVLYGKLRPYLNKVAVPDAPGRCTTEMIPLLCLNCIDRHFLAWLLRRRETVEFAMQGKTGSRMPRANMDSFLTLEIPLPPLPEQECIARLLGEQMAAVEKARAAAEEELATINALPAGLLRRAFSGEI